MRSCVLTAILTLLFLPHPGAVTAQKPVGKPDGKESAGPVSEIGGRKLKEWVGDISSRDPSKAEAALRTVVLFGPEQAFAAAPVILKELKKHGPETHLDTSVRAN